MGIVGRTDRPVLHVGHLTLRPDAFIAELSGRVVSLTPSQVELLTILVTNRERVVTRAELAISAGLKQERSVDVVLSSLRRRLAKPFVRNVRSRGWILDPSAFEQ